MKFHKFLRTTLQFLEICNYERHKLQDCVLL